MAFATSAGSPSLPTGCASRIGAMYSSGSSTTASVAIVPGATALTRMPLAAHSTARCLVIPEATNLAGPVRGLLGLPGETRDRGQADYGTSRLRLPQHGLDGELAGEEHAPTVHGHHTVPVLRSRLHDGIQRDDAGVGHKYVYASEALDGRTYHASRVLHDRDVPDDGLDLRARSCQPLSQPRETGLVHIRDDEARLFVGEELGGRLSDALRGPRDYGHLSTQPAESPCCYLRHAISSAIPRRVRDPLAFLALIVLFVH